MRSCWKEDPEERPPFHELHSSLKRLLDPDNDVSIFVLQIIISKAIFTFKVAFRLQF